MPLASSVDMGRGAGVGALLFARCAVLLFECGEFGVEGAGGERRCAVYRYIMRAVRMRFEQEVDTL